MVVVVFRARLKAGVEKEVEEIDARMAGLAATMPGFVLCVRDRYVVVPTSVRRFANGFCLPGEHNVGRPREELERAQVGEAIVGRKPLASGDLLPAARRFQDEVYMGIVIASAVPVRSR
jgi:hypothetical protein